MKQKGQVQLTFGMMFSIIIIVVTLAVAAYVIIQFLKVGEDAQCKTFTDALQKRIEKTYESDQSNDRFSGSLPRSVSFVCFGNMSSVPEVKDAERFESLKRYALPASNLFFAPVPNPCQSSFGSVLKHAAVSRFFCVPVKKGNAEVLYAFDVTKDTAVRLLPS